MTVTTLRPNGTHVAAANIVPSGTTHAALSDDSDTSYTYDNFGGFHRVSLTTFTIPAGGVVKSFQIRVRARSSLWPATLPPTVYCGPCHGNTTGFVDQYITGYTSSFSTRSAAVINQTLSQSQLNNLSLFLADPATLPASMTGCWHSEAYVDITVAEAPLAPTVSAPVSPVLATLRPQIVWTHNAGSDGGVQTKRQVKIFSAAQYSIGGFDPATSPHTLDSGTGSTAVLNWTPGSDLSNNTTYRAYVRTLATTHGTDQASPWGFVQFDINYPNPPSVDPLTPTGAQSAQPTTATWTYTPGLYGGPQKSYQVKIFSAAQYGIGGFDPETSPNSYDSGVVSSAVASHTFPPLALPNAAAYRLYVKVQQDDVVPDLWSVWAFEAFTTFIPIDVYPIPNDVPEQPSVGYSWTYVRLTPPILYEETQESRTSIVTWVVDTPPNFKVQSTIDGGFTWQDVINGAAIPGFAEAVTAGTPPAETVFRQIFTGAAILSEFRVEMGEQILIDTLNIEWAYTPPDVMNPSVEKSRVRRTGSATVRGELPDWFDVYNFYFQPWIELQTQAPQYIGKINSSWTGASATPFSFSNLSQVGDTLLVFITVERTNVDPGDITIDGMTQIDGMTPTGSGEASATVAFFHHITDPNEIIDEYEAADALATDTKYTSAYLLRGVDHFEFLEGFNGSIAAAGEHAFKQRVSFPATHFIHEVAYDDVDPLTPTAESFSLEVHNTYDDDGHAFTLYEWAQQPSMLTPSRNGDHYEGEWAGGDPPIPSTWPRYYHGMNWNCTGSGTINDQPYEPGDKIYINFTEWTPIGTLEVGEGILTTSDGTVLTDAFDVALSGLIYAPDGTVGVISYEDLPWLIVQPGLTPVELIDIDNRVQEVQPHVLDPVLTNDAPGGRDVVTYTLALYPTASWIRFHLGYMLNTLPVITDDGILPSISFELADRTYRLATREIGEYLYVPEATNIGFWVSQSIFTVFGITDFDYPVLDDVASTEGFAFEPSTSWLEAYNSLLDHAGFTWIWADEDGVLHTTFAAAPSTDPEWVYIPGSAMVAQTTVDPILSDVPNEIKFIASPSGPTLPVEGNGLVTKTNVNVGPASVSQRGDTISMTIPVNAATQTELEAVADSEAQRIFAGGGVRVSLNVAINPLHSDQDVVLIKKPRVGLPNAATYLVQSWGISLKEISSESDVLMNVVAEQIYEP